MARRQRPKDIALSDEEDKRLEELKKELENAINELPDNDPTRCEGLIRELHKKVLAVQKDDVKDHLLTELKRVSSRGLEEELKTMMEKNGLGLEGLTLVLKYLTTTKELAQHLFMTPEEAVDKEGLGVIRRRLGPNLEVLGGLSSKGIDVTKGWAKNLVQNAPSMQSLGRLPVGELEEHCKEASHGEMEDVRRLVKVAESRNRKLSADTPDDSEPVGEKGEKNKAIDEEKLEKARALMNEAKEMAKKESEAAKKAVNEKMAEIGKILELPPDWNEQDIGKKPEELFEQLDKIIDEFDNAVEVSECYKSDLEVVEKASGGRALCGIYHSEYVAPITAERPLIAMPAKVTLGSPNNSQQIRYLKFSESRAASNYVHTVKSSSTNVGFSVGGFYGLFVGEVSGSYASSHDEDTVTSKKENTNSASVLQYIWIATKTFKIEQEQMKLSTSARRMARSIVKDRDPTAAARHFMERYGSHLPAGLHTLGGVLFRIVDAESHSTKETTKLTEKAAQKLQGQISVGFLGGAFGIGASISAEHSSSSGKASAQEEEAEDTSYTYSFQAMGPAATNPATFTKLLANNSTWALIDRGSQNAYIPVWELIRDLGTDFEGAAKVLEETWGKDEEQNRLRSLRVGYKITKIIKDDLERLRDQFINKKPDEGDYGYWPKNGAQLTFSFQTINLSRREAYEKAVEIIMADPRYRICEIALCAGEVYTLRCWKASEVAEMTFESVSGEHVLFYSEIIFRWKDKVPVKE
ncbi:hypothetical protein ACROYT_G022711 [Oculina patagonica]